MSAVVIYVNDPSCGEDRPTRVEGSRGKKRGKKHRDAQRAAHPERRRGLPVNFPHAAHDELVGRPVDPYRMACDFPDRWGRYIRSHYRGLREVCQVFDVSERTARTWWEGASGARGHQVAIAWNRDPEIVMQTLFAAE